LLAAQSDTDNFRRYLNDGFPYAVKAAEKGDEAAMYSAGLMSAMLRRPEARQWLERAEAAGHPHARAMISTLELD
jgi:TPR repeat protein